MEEQDLLLVVESCGVPSQCKPWIFQIRDQLACPRDRKSQTQCDMLGSLLLPLDTSACLLWSVKYMND